MEMQENITILFKVKHKEGFVLGKDTIEILFNVKSYFEFFRVFIRPKDNSYPVFDRVKVGDVINIEAPFIDQYTLDGEDLVVYK